VTTVIAVALVCAACSGPDGAGVDSPVSPTQPATTQPATTQRARPFAPLEPGTSWQWQLDGGVIDETALDHVTNHRKMYDIDMETTDRATIERLRAKGIYVVCYIEIGARESYRLDADRFPETVLGNTVDGYPDERFVDIRAIDVLLPIMIDRLDRAADKGCDGIEPDLDDTFRSDAGFPLTMDDQLTYNRLIADAAHARGMSIGLKNGVTDDGEFLREMSAFTDWALNEECNMFDECAGYGVYIDAGKAVFQVEYIENGTMVEDFCEADNAADFDGLLKQSSDSLGALPRVACRFG
jgi:hypothetical protein